MKVSGDFDFIIAGAGCAGLSAAMALKRSDLQFNRVLLADRGRKATNDRTWCYWSRDADQWYDSFVFRRWNHFSVRTPSGARTFDLGPYQYRMLRGIDFYNECYRTLMSDSRFEFIEGDISEIYSLNDKAVLRMGSQLFTGRFLFNSVFLNQREGDRGAHLVQQFKGWLIRCAKPHGLAEPLLMDFGIDQMDHCRFMYVLPISSEQLLVECTAFTERLRPLPEFEKELRQYISHQLGISAYSILETEYGEIPMSERSFYNPYGDRVIGIGTAGGAAKPSSGYTFLFIQRQVQAMAEDLLAGRTPGTWRRAAHYRFYDSLLLRVLRQQGSEGYKLFEDLFNRCRIGDVLPFLNEESTLAQDIRVISSMPKLPFMKELVGKVLEA